MGKTDSQFEGKTIGYPGSHYVSPLLAAGIATCLWVYLGQFGIH